MAIKKYYDRKRFDVSRRTLNLAVIADSVKF